MSRRAGIESSNILEGPRKRLRGNNDASTDDTTSAAAAASSSSATATTTAGMGAIERRIHSLSPAQILQYGQKLMDTIMEAIDPSDGAPLHEFFLELPSAVEYPDYYEIIKRPMSLEEIQHKLDQHIYPGLPEIKHDFETICNNAKRYNLRDTPVWLKAKELHSLIKITYVQIVESLPEPSAAPATPVAAPTATDSTGAAAGAEATPSRSKRILLRSTKSQQKLNEQVLPKAEPQEQLVPPMPSGSQLAKQESQQLPAAGSTTPMPSLLPQQQGSLPSTPARQSSQQPYTAAGTPSSAADDDEDADGEDDRWDMNDADSSKLTKGGLLDGRKRPGKRGKRLKATLRQLVHDLRRVIGTRGYPLVQHFDALPDRRKNPEYYQVIQNPTCLRDIEHRVYEKGYINAHALFVDLERMLNNAMTFYAPDTPISQDAHEIRQYFEREAIPALIQDGFTLEKDDVRQSALPLHLAANSTIEAHKAAYKMIVSKTGVNGASQSPEPSSRARLGSAGVAGSPAPSAGQRLPAGSPGAFGSPSPAAQPHVGPMMSTPGANPAAMMTQQGLSMSMPMSMPMAPPMGTPTSMSPMAPMPGMPGMPGVPGMGMVGSPGRPMQFPGTAMTPTASPVRPGATPEGRRPVGRPPGKSTPSRSNPYPFLERRIGPGRPKKHEAAARQAAIAAHEEMLRKQALQQQHEDIAQQQQAAALASQPIPQWQQQQLLQQQQLQQQLILQQQQRQQEQAAQRQQQQQQRRQQQQQQQQQAAQQQAFLEQQQQFQQRQFQQQYQQQHPHGLSPCPSQQMLPPGTPGAGASSPFRAGMVVAAEPASPAKRKEAVLPAEPKEALPFEGLEERTPLIATFAIGMEVEEPDGQVLSVPPLEIKNGLATQHTLQIPPNASSITIEFPLRMLNKKSHEEKGKGEEAIDPALGTGDGDASMDDGAADGANGTGDHDDATKSAAGEAQPNGKPTGEQSSSSSSLIWPWEAELSFNGKQTTATWTAADALIDPALLADLTEEDKEEETDKEYTTSIGHSYCKVRLLPKRGINVFEISVRPDNTCPELVGLPAERYSLYFC
ncbi:related to RSC1 - component of the RSC chromatin remodeling complex [Ustilago trichophora]|uniref:Related to RSC1 - component of the RSC chromatin remodeling complex n=1 Tax=Ustilago trichophora TaxID=86804 RepID=A0A5C3E9G8_9BASI|nr:related to RSC1 - component of the RSC chromatin remodeling complex [Ustilago trichophora]